MCDTQKCGVVVNLLRVFSELQSPRGRYASELTLVTFVRVSTESSVTYFSLCSAWAHYVASAIDRSRYLQYILPCFPICNGSQNYPGFSQNVTAARQFSTSMVLLARMKKPKEKVLTKKALAAKARKRLAKIPKSVYEKEKMTLSEAIAVLRVRSNSAHNKTQLRLSVHVGGRGRLSVLHI